MNSQNTSASNIPNQFPNFDAMQRFMIQPPANGVFDPNVAMLFHPEMQIMLKWRTQMAQILRSQPPLINNPAYQDMMMPPHLLPPIQRGNQPQYWDRSGRPQPSGFPANYRTSQIMPPYPQYVRRNPMQLAPSVTDFKFPMRGVQFPKQLLRENRLNKKPLQKERQNLIPHPKARQVIVIDQDEDEVVPIKQKTEAPKPIQKPTPPPVINNPKMTRSREVILPKKQITTQNIYERKTNKTSHTKNANYQKIQEDSFKPHNLRTKKIRKKISHRQTQREKVLKQKKQLLQQKNIQAKSIDGQGKIIVSTFHQAIDPQFQFGKPEYDIQKEKKRQSLLSRLQFQGSQLRQEYKKLKQVVPNWSVGSLIGILKQKFGSLPLCNRAHLLRSNCENENSKIENGL